MLTEDYTGIESRRRV